VFSDEPFERRQIVGQTIRHTAIPLALLALACALACARPALAAVETERVAEPASDVRDYWTDARLEAAVPPDLPIAPSPAAARGAGTNGSPSWVAGADAGSPPRAAMREGEARPDGVPVVDPSHEEIADPAAPDVSAHGKVFFTVPSGAEAGDYVCSGTAVNSRNRSVVWTAGHCVYPEGGPDFVTNWVFIPGYHEGEQPYGQWPAKRLATTGPWQEVANIKYDLGAAVVRRTGGRRLEALVGARGIAFNQPRDQLYGAYGYPAVPTFYPEFTGEREFRCVSKPTGDDEPGSSGPQTMSIQCDMTGGSSGGGWIAGTTLLSVTSYGYTLELDRLYGPYMSQTAKALYASVRGKPKRKSSGHKGGKGGGKKPRL
jgi:V8-like Glu-specific endopeptidase